MGVYRPGYKNAIADALGCPHARGGVPVRIPCMMSLHLCVVPTLVGVYRLSCGSSHSCSLLSPRSWGCTGYGEHAADIAQKVVPTLVGVYRHARTQQVPLKPVVPTLVGVYRQETSSCLANECSCPHARGGVPSQTRVRQASKLVVPTLVGVYRLVPWMVMRFPPLSPRSWGCTGGV